MELLTPSPFLMVWQLTMLVALILFLVSWVIILLTKKMGSSNKLAWLLGTLFLPVVGPILFLLRFRSLRKRQA